MRGRDDLGKSKAGRSYGNARSIAKELVFVAANSVDQR